MMRNLFVFLAGVVFSCSALALSSRVIWGEPIGIDSLPSPPVQEKAAIQEEVRAKKFVLVNEKGATLGAFGMFQGQTNLMLYDQNDQVRVAIALDRDGQPAFVLLDDNGKHRAQFDLEENEPRLMLLDANGKVTFQVPQ